MIYLNTQHDVAVHAAVVVAIVLAVDAHSLDTHSMFACMFIVFAK